MRGNTLLEFSSHVWLRTFLPLINIVAFRIIELFLEVCRMGENLKHCSVHVKGKIPLVEYKEFSNSRNWVRFNSISSTGGVPRRGRLISSLFHELSVQFVGVFTILDWIRITSTDPKSTEFRTNEAFLDEMQKSTFLNTNLVPENNLG